MNPSREQNKTRKDKDWMELCDYVKKEILLYDDNMKFPSYLALKLQGLKKGKHIANNKIKDAASYDDYTLLCTFKLCKGKILDYISKNESRIVDEKHRINLIIKMVEPEINDVYSRLLSIKRDNDSLKSKTFDNQFNSGAKYTKKTEEVNERLRELF